MKVFVLFNGDIGGPVGVVTNEGVAQEFLKLSAKNDYYIFNVNESNDQLRGLDLPQTSTQPEIIDSETIEKLKELKEKVENLSNALDNKKLKTSFLRP